MIIGKAIQGVWLKIGPLLVIIVAVALPIWIGELNGAVRRHWTYCFDDPVPPKAEALLAAAEAALKRNDEATASSLAEEGRFLVSGAAAQWPYKRLPSIYHYGPPGWIRPATSEIEHLRTRIREYRYECYPLRMLEHPRDSIEDWIHRNDPQI